VIASKPQNPVQVFNVNAVEVHETVATDSDEVVLNELIDESISEELLENDLITDEYSNDIIESEQVIAVVEDKNTDVEDKSVTLLQTENTKEKPLIICVKSYGDYRYIEAKDICYLQADNNSTDIHLNTGEMITAFKTLKHFEGLLTYPFVRIHNSYIVNIDYVSRIHTGNAVCHIKNTTTKLPFSKSYKENIDAIIATIASGNYLEI
jgi:DNA-binding LytR/AlgR family response regulator